MVAQSGSGYAGDITAREAWDLLAGNPDAVSRRCPHPPGGVDLRRGTVAPGRRQGAAVRRVAGLSGHVRASGISPRSSRRCSRSVASIARRPFLLLCRSGARSRCSGRRVDRVRLHQCLQHRGWVSKARRMARVIGVRSTAGRPRICPGFRDSFPRSGAPEVGAKAGARCAGAFPPDPREPTRCDVPADWPAQTGSAR